MHIRQRAHALTNITSGETFKGIEKHREIMGNPTLQFSCAQIHLFMVALPHQRIFATIRLLPDRSSFYQFYQNWFVYIRFLFYHDQTIHQLIFWDRNKNSYWFSDNQYTKSGIWHPLKVGGQAGGCTLMLRLKNGSNCCPFISPVCDNAPPPARFHPLSMHPALGWTAFCNTVYCYCQGRTLALRFDISGRRCKFAKFIILYCWVRVTYFVW